MLVLCWQQAHLAGSKPPPGASDWYYNPPPRIPRWKI